MQEFIQKQIENGFSEFEGLSITGTIPVRDTLLNSLLTEALQKLAEGSAPAPSTSSPPAPGGLLPGVAKLVKKAEVHAKEGVIVFEFEVKR
jgi:hypothetical protein